MLGQLPGARKGFSAWAAWVRSAFEVSLSPWREPSPLSSSSRVWVAAPLLEEAVDDLLTALAPWPWRQARAAQLAASLRASLEGALGRPARVSDLFSNWTVAWLAARPEAERPLAERLLRELSLQPGALSERPSGARHAHLPSA